MISNYQVTTTHRSFPLFARVLLLLEQKAISNEPEIKSGFSNMRLSVAFPSFKRHSRELKEPER